MPLQPCRADLGDARDARRLFRHVRTGLYGVGSGMLAAVLAGSVALQPGAVMQGMGLLAAFGACLLAVILELLEMNLERGGADEG